MYIYFFNMKFSLYYILYNLSSLMITLENFLELLPLTSPQFISICILSPIQESTGVAPESLHPHQIRPNAMSSIQRTDSPFFFFFFFLVIRVDSSWNQPIRFN